MIEFLSSKTYIYQRINPVFSASSAVNSNCLRGLLSTTILLDTYNHTHTNIDLDHHRDRGDDLDPEFDLELDFRNDLDPEFDLGSKFDLALDLDLGNDLELDLGKLILQIKDL